MSSKILLRAALLVLLLVSLSSSAFAFSEQSLVIVNPNVNLNDYVVWEAEERRNDPRSADPNYIYLVINEDAVRIVGPKLSKASDIPVKQLFILEEPNIRYIHPNQYSARGIHVRVNSRLSYRIEIQDFEYEVVLAQVTLTKENQSIRSRFVFAAVGDGLAMNITIKAIVDGVSVKRITPFTIEARND